tara:strand:- start:612 stop:1463 length:852 start_codon:yes stop_codon:yes gene_type:complete
MSNNNYLSIYAKSFNWAGFFLPKEIYLKCSALYDFCRTVDNIADENDDLKNKKIKLEKFISDFKNKNFENLIVKNMWDLVNDVKISTRVIYDLFDGVESDLKTKVILNSQKDLLIYSYRVAGTVGLMMAKILNVKKQSALKAAIDLGVAMQLTNISRDVVEDSKNNRSYIKPTFNSIKETLKVADLFYERSFISIKEIPLRYRFSILVARRVYRKIGDKIISKENIENYNKSGKIYVTNFGKIIQTILSLSDLIKLLFTKPDERPRDEEHLIINEEINLNERI